MDYYHFISKCSENYVSDTRVTKIFLPVSAQELGKKDKKLQVQMDEHVKYNSCNKIEFRDIILSFFPLFLTTNNNKNTAIKFKLKLGHSQCIIFQLHLVTASYPEFNKLFVLSTSLPPVHSTP